jgi:hypothetical protein
VLALIVSTVGMAGSAYGADNGTLLGVACHRGMVCIAVGSYMGPHTGDYVPLVEHLGRDVVRQRVPVPRRSRGSQLVGISCPTRTTCIAVGYTTDPNEHAVPLVEHWNHGSWSAETIRPFPGPGGSSLGSVSCPTADQCTAVGSSNGQPLVEHWDGASWSSQTMPRPPGSILPDLRGVSCSSSTSCVAVGGYTDANRHRQPFAADWDGSAWSITSAPYFRSKTSAELTGVSCISSQSCIAVAGGVIQRWDGTSWTPEASPHNHIHLQAVSCTSESNCVAVGRYLASGADRTYAEVWDGVRWTSRRPVSPAPPDEFWAVSCSAATRCAGVGAGMVHDLFTGLSEHWDGRRWGNVHWH